MYQQIMKSLNRNLSTSLAMGPRQKSTARSQEEKR